MANRNDAFTSRYHVRMRDLREMILGHEVEICLVPSYDVKYNDHDATPEKLRKFDWLRAVLFQINFEVRFEGISNFSITRVLLQQRPKLNANTNKHQFPGITSKS